MNQIYQINDIGLHPLLREVALADPDLFAQVESVFMFDFPLVDAMMLFTKDNRAYVFGDNHQEALGFKLQKKGTKILTRIGRPRELELLRHKKIVSVAYRRHVMVLTSDGKLFGWGRNDNGPLGVSKGRDFSIRPIELMNGVWKIATYHHTIVLKEDGRIYCFGLNVDKQVNPLVNDDVQYFPMQVDIIRERCVEVACSSKLSVVLTETNVVYMWGTVQGIVINLHQSLDHCGKVRKMIVLEYKNFDTWLLTLNHDRKIYLHRYDRRVGRLISKQFSNLPRNIVDIISSDHSSFALVHGQGQCLIEWNKEEARCFDYESISTDMTSIADASKLYRIRFKTQSLCQLSPQAKDLNTIQLLRSFNNPPECDFKIGWETSLMYPCLLVKKSLLIKHCPSLKDILQGSELIWPNSKEHGPNKQLGPFNYRGVPYPSYQAMYGFVMFAYTGKIYNCLSLHTDELVVLANYFHDEKFKSELQWFEKSHEVPKSSSRSSKIAKLNRQLT